jgi:hypothetical protein
MPDRNELIEEAIRTLLKTARDQHAQINILLHGFTTMQEMRQAAANSSYPQDADNKLAAIAKKAVAEMDLIYSDKRSTALQSLLDQFTALL